MGSNPTYFPSFMLLCYTCPVYAGLCNIPIITHLDRKQLVNEKHSCIFHFWSRNACHHFLVLQQEIKKYIPKSFYLNYFCIDTLSNLPANVCERTKCTLMGTQKGHSLLELIGKLIPSLKVCVVQLPKGII